MKEILTVSDLIAKLSILDSSKWVIIQVTEKGQTHEGNLLSLAEDQESDFVFISA